MQIRSLVIVVTCALLWSSCSPSARKPMWSWEVESGCIVHSAWGSIADDNHFYIASNCRQVTALDKDTGEEVWRFTAGAFVKRAEPLVHLHEGILYVHFPSRVIYALETETGDTLWDYRIEGSEFAPLLVSPRGLVLVVAEGRLLALDGMNGKLEWELDTDGADLYPLSINDEVALVTVNDTKPMFPGRMYSSGKILAIDLTSGDAIWHHTSTSLGILESGTAETVCGGSSGGRFFVVVSDQVMALRSDTGEIEWQYELGTGPVAQVLFTDGKVIIVVGKPSSESGIVILRQATGEVLHIAEISDVLHAVGVNEEYLYLERVCYPLPETSHNSSTKCDVDFVSLARFALNDYEQPVSRRKVQGSVLSYDVETGIVFAKDISGESTVLVVAEKPW